MKVHFIYFKASASILSQRAVACSRSPKPKLGTASQTVRGLTWSIAVQTQPPTPRSTSADFAVPDHTSPVIILLLFFLLHILPSPFLPFQQAGGTHLDPSLCYHLHTCISLSTGSSACEGKMVDGQILETV